MPAEAAHAPDNLPKAKIFISYSRKDMAFADRLEAELNTRGFEVLIDRQEIYAFEDWWKRIETLIGGADTVVFVLSPDAVKSDVALREITYAAALNKRFAPIVFRRVEGAAIPEALRRLNFIFFDNADRLDASADQLAEALQTDIVWVRDHTKFGETARAWITAGRPNGLLLRTPALEMAEYWIASRPRGAPEAPEDVRAFVAASRRTEVAARRRSRILNTALYGLLIAIILGLVGWINQNYLITQWRWYTIQRPFIASNISPYVLKPADEPALKAKDSFRECVAEQDKDYCPEMVVLPAGSFVMGSPAAEQGRYDWEGPQHQVTIAKPFAVSKFELTFAEWDTCVAYGDCEPVISDAGFGRGRQPLINVTWEDAEHYVVWLSRITGRSYRLLSEAEYEYAARAGTQTPYPWGDDIMLNGAAMANCVRCGSKWDMYRTAPVGSFPPNKFGLYDMVGNVWEWVEDCLHAPSYNGAPIDGSAWTENGYCRYHIVRAGKYDAAPRDERSAFRMWITAATQQDDLGFRVARTLDTR
jgi:formylglycine-generating enzyme required for sulfatase activity